MTKEWSIEKINELITNKIEESLNLDYKASGSLDKNSEKKKIEITKDISAFANSAGGIIIYGIKEINHFPQEYSFIDGQIYTKEWLEQIINNAINKKIDSLKIHPIRVEGDIEKTIYVVEIPESDQSPHMARDNKYYRRYNFESVPMEEYEVQLLYNKIGKSKLEIVQEVIGAIYDDENPNKITGITISFIIKNTGKNIENNFKLEIKIPSIPMLKTYGEDLMKYSNFSKYSASNISPIFQNEEIMIGSLGYNFEEHDLDIINKDLELEITLYYTNGIETAKLNLKDIYTEIITF